MKGRAQTPMSFERLHYMDNLRALAMLIGVVFHAGLAYSVLAHPIWPTADTEQSMLVDLFAWFFHLFRMPLFFVVAGFFAAVLVERRGMGGMLKNRCMRILFPLLVFWPLVYFSIHYLIRSAVNDVEHLSPLLQILKPWLDNPHAPAAAPTLVHLWFLPYVMCFCILVWVASTLEWTQAAYWLAHLTPIQHLSLVPMLMVPALFAVPAPFPAPESFFPQWWALLFYGLYFLTGFRLFHQGQGLNDLAPYASRILLLSVLAYAGFSFLLHSKGSARSDLFTQTTLAVLQAYVGYWMTLVCLIFGQKWLDTPHRVLRYIADASYWVYLIHLPLIFAIQVPLMDLAWHWAIELCLTVGGTLGVAFLTYHIFVRRSFLGAFLNGQRSNT